MQSEKYRRRKRHDSMWAKERRARARQQHEAEMERVLREAPWWERLIWWILRI